MTHSTTPLETLTRDNATFLQALTNPRTEVVFHTMNVYRTYQEFGFEQRVINENVLNYIIDGGGLRAQCSDHPQDIPPGGVVWVAPGAPHSFSHETPGQYFRMYNIRFSLSLAGDTIGFSPNMFALPQAHHHRKLFELMFEDRDKDHSLRHERFKHCLYLMYTDIIEPTPSKTGSTLNQPQRQCLFSYVHEHLHKRINTAEIANHMGLSEDYFRRMFQRSFGQSVSHWVMHQRIHQASNHLMNGANVTETAKLMGYRDIYLFSRQFKQVMGIPPSHYAAKAPETQQLIAKPTRRQ